MQMDGTQCPMACAAQHAEGSLYAFGGGVKLEQTSGCRFAAASKLAAAVLLRLEKLTHERALGQEALIQEWF